MKLKCTGCKKKTPHQFVENLDIIRVINRSGKRRIGLFRKHYCCVLMKDQYYLYSCSIYQCLKCGKQKKLLGFPKKITKEKAKKYGIKIMNNLAFWTFIYH